jgi:hypothetical protein
VEVLLKIRITVVSIVLGFVLACTGESTQTTVVGDRANEGCPDDETCSDLAPRGLLFRGQMLYDEGVDRLGPILVGGQFDLSFYRSDADLSYFEVELDEHLDQTGLLRDPPGVMLWGLSPGSSSIRVVDPETGALLDRLTIDVVALEDVVLSNVVDPERTTLYAGCEEMVGVSLVAGGGTLRAFDQNIKVTAPGSLIPDPGVWDCFRYQVPADTDTVLFEVEAAGEVWPVEFEVVELEEGQDCPPLGD